MAIQYIIYYDFVDPNGFVHMNQHTPPTTDREEAVSMWKAMKKNPCFANMRGEKKEPEQHIVRVAFKFYDYVVKGPVKTGDFIEVVAGGQIVKLEVLKTDVPKQNGINYVFAERVLKK